MSANTIFLVNVNGRHDLKFGPCRSLNQDELRRIVDYFVKEVKVVAFVSPCQITFLDRYNNDPNPPTTMHYDPKEDNGFDKQPDLVLTKFFEWQTQHIANWNIWRGVSIVSDNGDYNVTYEFEDIDLD